jgi:AcrR family transcriptional regulator
MKSKAEDENRPARDEARQLLELIRVFARTLGFNNSALARSANVPLATLVRYFNGQGEPKLEFLLSLVRTLGLDVREFFEMAYPPVPAPTPARTRIASILQSFKPGAGMGALPQLPKEEPRDPSTPLRREDMEQMLAELRREMREMADKQEQRARQMTRELAKRQRQKA